MVLHLCGRAVYFFRTRSPDSAKSTSVYSTCLDQVSVIFRPANEKVSDQLSGRIDHFIQKKGKPKSRVSFDPLIADQM